MNGIYNSPHPDDLARQEDQHKREMEIQRQEHETRKMIAMMKAQQSLEIMPINSTQVIPNNTIVISVYEMLEHCGDLLATGAITGSEWMKLKKLLRSNNEEDINLVKGILDAKVEIK